MSEIDDLKAFVERLKADPIRSRDFLKKLLGNDTREVVGEEYDELQLIFRLLEPVHSSNNQRTWTDVYEQNGRTYEITGGNPGFPPVIIEILKDPV